jgi:hypothetical protein
MASPGPLADQAFRFGLTATVVISITIVGGLYGVGRLSLQLALLALFLGLPVLFILVSCVLGVWLGYNQEPLIKVVEYDHEWPLDREK